MTNDQLCRQTAFMRQTAARPAARRTPA